MVRRLKVQRRATNITMQRIAQLRVLGLKPPPTRATAQVAMITVAVAVTMTIAQIKHLWELACMNALLRTLTKHHVLRSA